MVYNNPATANVDMMPELIARLAQIPNCQYVKESTLDPTRVRDIIRLAGDKMTVFAGVLGYESFWLGAEGWVAVCSNVIPRWSAELFELVADKRDMDAALALYKKMTPLLWWVGGPRYVSGTKACFEMMGMPMGPPRAPRLPLPEAQRPALREVLRQMGVLAEERRARVSRPERVAELSDRPSPAACRRRRRRPCRSRPRCGAARSPSRWSSPGR